MRNMFERVLGEAGKQRQLMAVVFYYDVDDLPDDDALDRKLNALKKRLGRVAKALNLTVKDE